MPVNVAERTRSNPASFDQRKSIVAVIVGGYVDALTEVDRTDARGV